MIRNTSNEISATLSGIGILFRIVSGGAASFLATLCTTPSEYLVSFRHRRTPLRGRCAGSEERAGVLKG